MHHVGDSACDGNSWTAFSNESAFEREPGCHDNSKPCEELLEKTTV